MQMKGYAELMGNHESHRIKSLWDNTLNRANVLLLDEYRMIDKDTIDTILKKFLTQQRMPTYSELSDEERKEAYDKEDNITIYASSAYFVDHWSYTLCEDVWDAMIAGERKQFICGLPYQLSISEGLIKKSRIESETYERDFNLIKFTMEYEALWYGETDGAFFDYNTIAKNRKIPYPMLPERLAFKVGNPRDLRILPKMHGEKRILSADIALMTSRRHRNDATAVFVNCMRPTKAGRYTSNIVYSETYEGLRTDAQALNIRRLFDEFDCDYLVLDAQGVGMGLFDYLASDINDPDSGEIYPAISCCNNDTMAERCTVPGAPKVIWAMKASAEINSTCAYRLLEGFRSGRVRLLANEYDGERFMMQNINGFKGLSGDEQLELEKPYYDTTLLIDEIKYTIILLLVGYKLV